MNFKKDRVLLLETLRDLVVENMNYADIREFLDSEVSEYLMEFKDKKRLRRLKTLRKTLDEFIDEMTTEQELKETESKYTEEKLQKANETYAERINSP